MTRTGEEDNLTISVFPGDSYAVVWLGRPHGESRRVDITDKPSVEELQRRACAAFDTHPDLYRLALASYLKNAL